ncbi:polyprenyl synthetase family protein [Nocardioides acrostichi]|uniref:Polyprenyl synthetase family protein n=1 Tax=Nocardioides acrostichi TaxID=2784339 RepID=A0A930UU74_9ACTN|nr:polyprenyl synthetase family protein [Nocardioides acrostichi]MBF4160271.1 polyprenyl synthetase family protein [Nocardioides acrostichi]
MTLADRAGAQPAPDPAAAMEAVERLLAARLERLAQEWSVGASEDPVLGGHDLPRLLADLVLGGGKRLRPLLCHWGWVAAGGATRDEDPGIPVRLGAALELLHAFGLVQDDVMDASVTRRGRPAVHVAAAARHRAVGAFDDATRYGESVAVLVGDLAHAEADALVGGLAPAVRHLWWRTSVELVRGQARDLSGAALGGGADPVALAWEVARAKSGAYTVQRPVELGAVAAEAPPEASGVLTAFGRTLGEVFALRDDLLGVFGDPARTGKPVGDDLRSGKPTVLLAWTEQRCADEAAAAVRRLRTHTHDESDVDRVVTAMIGSGVRAEAEERVRRGHAAAVALLASPALDRDGAAGLREVADLVAWRDR